MTEFFKSLSAIGDTLHDNRIRNDRASALAGMSDSSDPADYDVAARRLIAQGDLQGGVSLAGLWQKLAQVKQAQDYAAMIMASRQAGAWPEVLANAVLQPTPIGPSRAPGAAAPPIAPGSVQAALGISPSPAAVDALRANPNRRDEYDAKYGRGAAQQILGRQ